MLSLQLPTTTTSFVGRTDELARISGLLADPQCRLLTLLGPGGIGKTRLALQAGASQLDQFRNGVYFVSLTPVTAPTFIPSAVASALQLSFHNLDDLNNYLNERQTLLVLDNFEHLLEGSDMLATLLQSAPEVRLLVTSRERLNLQEEWVLALDGLRVPENGRAEPLESYAAVQLFVQRARQVLPGFSPEDHADAVRLICQQVDGMPLALELAASWLRVISCEQIATQIARDLDFLTTPLRNVPERHRSLRVIFEQSWSLLTRAEQDALMRLSTFRGGFDLEAAEQVARALLPLLAGFVDKSLVRHNADQRYDLHELLRQYAHEKLVEAGATEAAANQHLDYFLALAEQAEAHFWGQQQQYWYNRLELELDNLRSAFNWSLNGGDPEKGLRLAAALGWLFTERSRPSEGFDWLERSVAANPNAEASLRARALNRAGEIAGIMADGERAVALSDEARELAQTVGDRVNIAWALSNKGYYPFLKRGAYPEAVELLEQSLAIFREVGEPLGLNHTLRRLAQVLIDWGDHQRARTLLEEALAGALEAEDKNAIAHTHITMGDIFFVQERDIPRAVKEYEISLAQFRELHNSLGMIYSLSTLGEYHHLLGDHVYGQQLYQEALVVVRDFAPNSNPYEFIIAGLGSVARALGNPERAVRLFSAVSKLFTINFANEHPLDTHFRQDVAALRDQLGEATFSRLWAAGEAMTREQTIAFGLQTEPVSQPTQLVQPNETQPATDALTERELEILRAVAAGYSNRKIAAELFLALGTVKWYLNTINGKLGVSSRTQAVARARELGLIP